jgi:uncharacterized protein
MNESIGAAPSSLLGESGNSVTVRRLYEARGNPAIIRQVLSPDVRWEVIEGFPYSDVYIGPDDVLGRFFARLFTDFSEWNTEASEFFEADNRVFALGTYSARAIATGRTFKARFAHVWTLRDGVIIRLQQVADTVQLARALER